MTGSEGGKERRKLHADDDYVDQDEDSRKKYRSRREHRGDDGSISTKDKSDGSRERRHHRRWSRSPRDGDEDKRTQRRSRSRGRDWVRDWRSHHYDCRRRDDNDGEGGRGSGSGDERRSRRPRYSSSPREKEHRKRRSREDGELRRKRGSSLSGRRRGDGDGGDRPDRTTPPVRRGGPLPSQADSFALVEAGGGDPEKPKEKPNYATTGVLAAASNSVTQADGTTITLKYHEPPEARKPSPRDEWRLFVFKGQDIVDTIPLSSRSCWLVGRESAAVDLLAEHPSVSKQHAVLQFRYVEKRDEFGDRKGKVKPYLIDLESANGTVLNGEKVPDSRYLELRDKDVVRFGHSTREYVIMLAPRG